MYYILKHKRDNKNFAKFVLVTEELKNAIQQEDNPEDIIDELFVTGLPKLNDRESCIWPTASYGTKISSIKMKRENDAIICDLDTL